MTIVLPEPPEHSGVGRVLNGVGAVIVAFWLATRFAAGGLSPVFFVIGLIALLAWAVRGFLSSERLRDACAVVMLIAGSAMVKPTDALLVTPAIIAVAAVASDPRHRTRVALAFCSVGIVVSLSICVVAGSPPSFLLGVLGGYVIGVVVGFNRRQIRISQFAERALLARDLEIDREQQRSSMLADRARVARDIHDVLAHSLGGLVIQLDAVEALLENGRTDEAVRRVAAARTLAAEGLGEARKAVATLRDPGAGSAGADTDDWMVAPDAIGRLVAAHESLGGRVDVVGTGDLAALGPAHRRAAAGITREALSNARRHAPGETVTLAVVHDEAGRILRLTVSNPCPALPAATPGDGPGGRPGPGSGSGSGGGGGRSDGHGHGLPGMRERIAELGDESRFEAGLRGDTFVVEAEVVTQ